MTTETLKDWLPSENLKGTPNSKGTRYPSGKLWPHGEWSLGYGKERPDGGDWHEDPYVGLGVDDVAMEQRAGHSPVPLNLSDAPNSHTAARRGLKGISGYGQQMIKAAGHLMQEKWPHHRKTLGTITLPGMTQQARAEIVALWPELTRQLLQWLSRRLERQGLPPIVCSVTEIQPSRLQETGQGCLHWHLLWLNQPGTKGNWAVDPCDVRAWLSELLQRKIPSYQGGHVNVNTKSVEGVVAAYLAKYMSKGKQMIAEALEDWGEDNCPRTWWNMTAPARRMVKAATYVGRGIGEVLERTLEKAWDFGVYDCYAFIAPIEIEFDGVAHIVGWRGRNLPTLDTHMRRGLESLDIERLGAA